MTVSLEQFVQYLTQSGLMSAADAASFQDALPPDRKPPDGETLARELVRANRLTKYQAQVLYQGKTKGLLFGEYRVLDKLGQGGMGVVLKAEHRRMKRLVAVKTIAGSALRSPDAVKRFYREVEAAAKLNHPNIVQAHDASEADGIHYLVMEYVEGQDLGAIVKERGPLPIAQAVNFILQAARGLQYAHEQGIVHRDIKPSNLILDHNGTVKILDLGIARFQPLPDQAGDDLTKTGCVLGTVDYMPPEQALNTRLADHRADVYSLGCTLYFLLTGQPLFGGETVMERIVAHREHAVPSLRKACPSAPPWLDGIFRKMVAKKSEDRYQSATALISDLERHAAPRSWKWFRIVVVATLVLAVGAWGAWLAIRHHGEPSSQNQEQKRLDLPIKPTWRTTSEYPLIAGVWSVAENKGTLVTVVQHGGEFVATASYKSGDETVSWRAEGTISRKGHITMSLVHTHPHPPDKWLPQTRTAVLGLHGKSLEGYAAFEGGGHKFTWKLVEPRQAEEKELSR